MELRFPGRYSALTEIFLRRQNSQKRFASSARGLDLVLPKRFMYCTAERLSMQRIEQ